MISTADRLIAEALADLKEAGKWTYDPVSRRYRDTTTGRYMTPTTRIELRDEVANRQILRMQKITQRLNAGEITPARWERELAREIRIAHTTQFAFGRGGRSQITAADREEIARLVQHQLTYLREFREQIRSGAVSAAQALARTQQYGNAAIAAYEAGYGASFGIPRLPAYPGDGSTECHGNCRCHWRITETSTTWEAVWMVESSNPCTTCSLRGRAWAPVVIPKDGVI